MSRQAVIVDTDVVVPGLLTADATFPVARIVDGMLTAAFPFVISEALLAEYRAVLVRPAVRKLHRLIVTEVETQLTEIAQHAIVLAAGVRSAAPDAGDQLLWACSPSGRTCGPSWVTRSLQRDAAMQSRVVSPDAYVERPFDQN